MGRKHLKGSLSCCVVWEMRTLTFGVLCRAAETLLVASTTSFLGNLRTWRVGREWNNSGQLPAFCTCSVDGLLPVSQGLAPIVMSPVIMLCHLQCGWTSACVPRGWHQLFCHYPHYVTSFKHELIWPFEIFKLWSVQRSPLYQKGGLGTRILSGSHRPVWQMVLVLRISIWDHSFSLEGGRREYPVITWFISWPELHCPCFKPWRHMLIFPEVKLTWVLCVGHCDETWLATSDPQKHICLSLVIELSTC